MQTGFRAFLRLSARQRGAGFLLEKWWTYFTIIFFIKSLQINKIEPSRNNLFSFINICSSTFPAIQPREEESSRPMTDFPSLLSPPSIPPSLFKTIKFTLTRCETFWTRVWQNSVPQIGNFHSLPYYRVDKLLLWFISNEKKTYRRGRAWSPQTLGLSSFSYVIGKGWSRSHLLQFVPWNRTKVN